MQKRVSKSYMNNLELQSLHYWFKNATSQNDSYKYNNILKIIQDTIYETNISDIIGTNAQQFTNFIAKPCINFYQREILRNGFEHWKMYVVHKLHTRRATYKANYFYHKKLQRKVLNALSKNVLLKWDHIVSSMNKSTNKSIICENYEKAEKHYRKASLRRYFKYWCNYISITNKKKEQAEKAAKYHDLYCLKKYIVKWKVYIMLQGERKIMHSKVDEARRFYRSNILRKYLKIWINICELSLQRNKIEYCIVHYENKLLIKYFSSWETYHDYKKKKLSREERVLTHSKKRLLKRYFNRFIMFVNESIAERVANENSEIFYKFKLVQKAFWGWQKWYNRNVEKAAKVYEARSILEEKLKRTMLLNWRLYLMQKKCRRRKTFAARNFYEKRLASKVLKKLRNYVSYRKAKKVELSYINDTSKEITKQLQINYIDKWRRALYCVMQEKQKLKQAIKFSELNLTRKYFANWQGFSRQYKMKMIRKGKLDEIATGFLLKKFIMHWHAQLQDVLVVRKKEILSSSMMEHKIRKKYFSCWKDYITQKIKKNNDTKAAIELHKKFLLREGLKEILRNSLRNIDYQRDMELETAAMRSFRNIEILKEYFDKWHSLSYIKNKSQHTRKVSNNNVHQIKQTPFDSFNTRLVLPEYMMEKSTIPVPCTFTKLPQDWSFSLFQPF